MDYQYLISCSASILLAVSKKGAFLLRKNGRGGKEVGEEIYAYTKDIHEPTCILHMSVIFWRSGNNSGNYSQIKV